MNMALKRIIQKWELSGQGDGGSLEEEVCDDNNAADDDDAEQANVNTAFGSLNGRPQQALDSQANFFVNSPTYLLYLWDVLDEHDLVQTSMQQLVDGVRSDNGGFGVPSVIGGKRKSGTMTRRHFCS